MRLRVAASLAVFVLLSGVAPAQSFVYSDFSSLSGLVLNGNAAQAGTDLRVTPAINSQRGSVFFDAGQDLTLGFDSTFDFRVSPGGADGMAFVAHADPAGVNALGINGGEMGYGGGTANAGISNVLAVEIDTYGNGNFGDPNSNHVSVHVHQMSQSPNESLSIGRITPTVTLADGNAHTMRVNYVPGLLEIYLDDPVTPILSIPYDVVGGGAYLNGQPAPGIVQPGGCAWIGFTSGTGGLNANHDVLNWTHVANGPPVTAFQVNQPAASLDLDGNSGSACAAYRKTTCVGETTTLNFSSNSAGPSFDLAISLVPLVAAGAGGIPVPGGQIFNVDLSQVFFLNSGTPLINLLPYPGPLSVPLVPTVPLLAGVQGIVVDNALPAGVALSAGVELEVIAASGTTSLPGPTGDDTSVSIDVTASPLCWCPGGIPFYGTTQSTLDVASNGRVVFGGPDNDFSATVAEALADNPFVGVWCDLSPNVGGSVTISSPGTGVVRVDWAGVPYFGQGATSNTFGVEFNCLTGDVLIDGLMGVVTNPGAGGTFLGMSPGNAGPATDPGNAPFAVGAVGAAANATDMLYDFGTGIPLSLATPGLSSIQYTPDGGGNYIWFGF